MKNKHVFESFQDFVEQILEKKNSGLITEGEARVSLTAAANTIIGDLKLSGEEKGFATKYFEGLETYLGGNADLAGKINDAITSAFEILNNAQKDISIYEDSNYSYFRDVEVLGPYKYLINGEVQAKGIPDASKVPMVIATTTQKMRLYDLLGAVNAYNFITFSNNVKKASELKNDKKVTSYIGENPVDSYLHIEGTTVTKRTMEFVKYPSDLSGLIGNLSGGYLALPVYSIKKTEKGKGDLIEKNYFEEVIKPGGTEIVIKEKAYSSSGVDFFEANDVVISASGTEALKSIISEFNKITEIKVNGSASSSNTNREGGNQKLAEDRRAAGIKELEDLKAAGVEQLKDAVIADGTATIQSGASKDSDPAMQQVSFIISGNARKSEIVDAAPVTIIKVEDTKADSFYLNCYQMMVAFYGDITQA
jgi:hypothetical protein